MATTITSLTHNVSDKFALYNSAHSSSKTSYKYDSTKKTNTISQEDNTIDYNDLDADEKIAKLLKNYKNTLLQNSIIADEDEEDNETDTSISPTLQVVSKMSQENYKKALSVNKDKSKKDKKTTTSVSKKEDENKTNQKSKTNLYQKDSEKVGTNNNTTKKTLEYSQGISIYNKTSDKRTDTNSFTITV